MKNGLVLGKFMPLHKGHMALIEFSAARCDALYVMVCTRDFEPIPGGLRYEWVSDTYSGRGNIHVLWVQAPLPDAPYPSDPVSKAWAEHFGRLTASGALPKIDTVFSSEGYGPMLAKYMGAEHVMCDHDRTGIPISATDIRDRPMANWELIAPCARFYFSKVVCVYGPESTGKSTLTKNLAARYRTAFVHETACDLFPDRHCEFKDMPQIAPRHFQAVHDRLREADRLLFVDTDLITTQIYSQQYFGAVPSSTFEYQRLESYDGYLFCDIDVPWVDENFRDLGGIRPFMRDWFLNELLIRKVDPFFVVGDWDARMRMAETAVSAIIRQPFKPHNWWR